MLIYRFAISLFAIATLMRTPRDERGDRLGHGQGAQQPHIWWHAASVGELVSTRAVLERLLAERPDLHVLVTTNTATAQDELRRWHLPRVSGRLAPLDLAWVTARMMRRWHVVVHVSLEAELWPNRVLKCPGPVILLGARFSAKTAKGWRKLPAFARLILDRVSYVSAQDAASADRLVTLGLPAAKLGPTVSLKAFYEPRLPKADETVDGAFDRTKTWLAASTHAGEEDIILDAHLRARRDDPDLTLILAPRHPDRGDAIAGMIAARGLDVARRSRGDAPRPGAVYLADTMGEMPRWYAAAGRVFVGGSLVDRGGHTPYEPAAFDTALIHGPDVANFAAAYEQVGDHVVQIGDADGLARALAALRDPDEQIRAGKAAATALRPIGDIDRVVKDVLALLPPSA